MSAPRSARRLVRLAPLALLGIAACGARPERAEDEDAAPMGCPSPAPERGFAVSALFVEAARFEPAVEAARLEGWPLPEPPEIELAAAAAAWRAEVLRAVFRRGVALEGRPSAGAWTLALLLERLPPSDRWLNAAGAEFARGPGALGCLYTLRDPHGVVVWQRHVLGRASQERAPRDASWSAEGAAILREDAALFAASLRAQ
jgi:hypothetical protein